MADHPLRVLIVGIKWPPETFIVRLVQGLLAQGLTVTLATPTKPDKSWQQYPGFNWLFTPLWEGVGQRLLQLIILWSRALLLAPADLRHFTAKPILYNWHHFLPFAGRRCPFFRLRDAQTAQ